MVSSAFPEATQAGVEMLRRGGNAIDAACAAAFALGVCEPQASGLGGQTLVIIHWNGRTFALDGSSRAPSLAHSSAFDRTTLRTGYRATTVPSTPAVLSYMNFHYGDLPWQEILEPAIRIARQGYRITPLQSMLQQRELQRFAEVPSRSGADYFLQEGENPHQPGELFVQRDLSDALERLSQKGVKDFYHGEIAREIDADMLENDGLLRYEDLALIPWPIERKVLRRKYRGLTLASMPPPGAGRTLLLVMRMLEHFPPALLAENTLRRYHLFAEVFRKAFRERAERPYDPNFFAQVKNKKMLEKSFAAQLASTIAESVDPNMPVVETADETRGSDTTHLSTMDAAGNVVSLTQSIERVYGSHAAAGGLGFLYNNYMMDYEYYDPSHPYYLRPNAVPWATVSPTIVFRCSQPWIALGSPGSERIFSTIAQFLVHVVDGGADIGEAMRRPRLHCSLGGRISIEADRFDPEIIEGLEEKHYRIDRRDPYAFYLGAIHGVLKRHDGGGYQGVAEIRRDGSAAGPE